MSENFTIPKRGSYIVIEGIDGSGKTTLAHSLVDYFTEKDIPAVYIKEPYCAPIIDVVERVKQSEYRNEDEILANLFAADRLMLKDIIGDYITEGVMVVSDRSKYSSYAYQNVDYYYNTLINQYMLDPHVLIYLDLLPEIAKDRYLGEDKFENTVFLENVYDWYRKHLERIAKENEIHWATYNLNNGATPEEVLAFMIDALENIFHIYTREANR